MSEIPHHDSGAGKPNFPNPIKAVVGVVKSAAEGVKDAGEWAMRNGPIQDPKQTQMPQPKKRK